MWLWVGEADRGPASSVPAVQVALLGYTKGRSESGKATDGQKEGQEEEGQKTAPLKTLALSHTRFPAFRIDFATL